jgi:LytS/YehU family sensor histidine kinase
MWHLITMGRRQEFPPSLVRYYIITFEFALIPAIISFYVFYAILFRRYLVTKKFAGFALLAGIVSIASAIFGQLVIYGSWGHNLSWTFDTLIQMCLIMSINALLNGIIGLILKGFITSFSEIKLKEELNRKNYEMELALMKSQIAPHFLFNTINSIDILIENDGARASEYLNKLSDIMRFMLYETKTEKIPMSKELDYIEKFIELQKIRTSNPDYVNYAMIGEPSGRTIPPMLFIPFIENAFKFSDNKKIKNAVNIRFEMTADTTLFTCENRYSPNLAHNIEAGGLGSELMQKRLTLLYPGRHELIVTDSNGEYRIKLKIEND